MLLDTKAPVKPVTKFKAKRSAPVADREPLSNLTLARLDTRWQAPWLIAGLSHWGQHHAEIGMPNQDAFAIGAVGATTWMAVADGVSSKPASGESARFVTRTVGAEIEARLERGGGFDDGALQAAIRATRDRLVERAVRANRPVSDFATTLLVAVLNDNQLTVAKIGDGYVLVLERQKETAVLVPLVENPLQRQGGEVIDLTHSAWKEYLCVRHIADRAAAGFDTVALGTDGCSRYFVRTEHANDDARRKAVPNADLIDGQFTTNLKRLGARNLFVYLASLLGHRQFVDEGDDRTLLIARHHPSSKELLCLPSTD
jgi:Protein phosphatase 2C